MCCNSEAAWSLPGVWARRCWALDAQGVAGMGLFLVSEGQAAVVEWCMKTNGYVWAAP